MVDRISHDMRPDEMVARIGRANPVIVECGCHDGRDTAKFLEAFPQCRIVCFEPDERPIERHAPVGFLDRIGEDARVKLIRAAVSDEDGVSMMYRSSGRNPNGKWDYDEWDHSGSICRPTGHLAYSDWCQFPESLQIPVPTVTLDSCLTVEQFPVIDLIWADVQGAEEKLIRGATDTLSRARWFYTEFYDSPMYEGQPNLSAIHDLLPGWTLDVIYAGSNALFRNGPKS